MHRRSVHSGRRMVESGGPPPSTTMQIVFVFHGLSPKSVEVMDVMLNVE